MYVLIKNKDRLTHWLIALFLLALPFNYALTWDIGFPLKISEIAIILIVLINVPKAFYKLNICLNGYILGFYKVFLFFFLIAIASFFINSFFNFPYSLEIPDVRYSPLMQSLLKTLYLIVIAMASLITYLAFTSKNQSFYLHIVNIGCLCSALFGWYLFVFSINQWPVYILPGMDVWPQHGLYSFGHFIRCGTFKEGNYAGLYFVCLFFINLQFKKYKWACLAVIGCIPTFSTIAFIILLFTGLLFLIKKGFEYKNALTAILILVVVMGMLLINHQDVKFITSKIVPTSEVQFKDANNSRLERLNLAQTAIKIAYNNPVFGVGLANFSKHFQHYNNSATINKRNIQYIPNNVYLEILSELGSTGFITFLLLIYVLVQVVIKQKVTMLGIGLAAILICFLAFPSFTLLFVWVYFGIILSFNLQNANTY